MLKHACLAAVLALSIPSSGCNHKVNKTSAKSMDSQTEKQGQAGNPANSSAESKSDERAGPSPSMEQMPEDAEAFMAIEPVAIGGSFLVCLEQPKGAQSTAKCRLENEAGEKIALPMNWQLTYYVQTVNAKMSLTSQSLPLEDPDFSWEVTLGKYKLANVMVEIFDIEKGTTTVTAPIPMDAKTMKARTDKDPRVKALR